MKLKVLHNASISDLSSIVLFLNKLKKTEIKTQLIFELIRNLIIPSFVSALISRWLVASVDMLSWLRFDVSTIRIGCLCSAPARSALSRSPGNSKRLRRRQVVLQSVFSFGSQGISTVNSWYLDILRECRIFSWYT